MQLRTAIFSWVVLTALLPLAVVVWLVVDYSESQFLQQTERAYQKQLTALGAEMGRWIAFENELALGLVASPALQEFGGTLLRAQEDASPRNREQLAERLQRVQQHLESFQRTVSDVSMVRVLNLEGNTLVKVRGGQHIPPHFESLQSLALVEQEQLDPAYLETLAALRVREVARLLLPQNRDEGFARVSFYDLVTPLNVGGERAGYLAITVFGRPLDRILEGAARFFGESLLVTELNPDQPARNGLVLYDEHFNITFANLRSPPVHLDGQQLSDMQAAVATRPFARQPQDRFESVLYFSEFHPYADQLISWLVAVRVPVAALSEPFSRIREYMLILVLLVIVLSLVVAGFGARRFSRPIASLAAGMRRYAEGDTRLRVEPQGGPELCQLAESFNAMAERLGQVEQERSRAHAELLEQAKLASMGRMAAGIAHEINNPLNNILAFAKLLERALPESAETQRHDVEAIRSEALRASEIVSSMLGFAREAPTHFRLFSLHPWIEETVKLVRSEADDAGVEIDYRCPEGVEMEGDRAQLQQCLINLLRNAVQASERGGSVELGVVQSGDSIALAVSDLGVGITEEQLNQVFEPFFTTKEVGEGAGLGLSVSLGLVRRHGGEITLARRDPQGVVATIRVPQFQHVREADRRTG